MPPTTRGLAAGPCMEVDDLVSPADAREWSWPPYAPVECDRGSFETAEWAPPSVVWHPRLRVGRWTVLYHR